MRPLHLERAWMILEGSSSSAFVSIGRKRDRRWAYEGPSSQWPGSPKITTSIPSDRAAYCMGSVAIFREYPPNLPWPLKSDARTSKDRKVYWLARSPGPPGRVGSEPGTYRGATCPQRHERLSALILTTLSARRSGT